MICNPLANNSRLQTLILRGNGISDFGLTRLTSALRKGARRLVNLDLSLNSIKPTGLGKLSATLVHLRLRNLRLDHNPLTDGGTDFSGIVALAIALKENRALTGLYLQNCQLIRRDMEKLKYANPDVLAACTEGVRALAECLGQNTALKEIDLQGNAINKRVARPLQETLTAMPTVISCIQVVKELINKRCAKEVKRWPGGYPVASARWLRIRVFRRGVGH